MSNRTTAKKKARVGPDGPGANQPSFETGDTSSSLTSNMPHTPRLFDPTVFGDLNDALDFVGTVLESSTQYSIIAKDLTGTILLWNRGARLLYGYEAEEVIGRMNAAKLHTPDDIAAGKQKAIYDAALKDGKWEGTVTRVRKDGTQFPARVVVTPRRDSNGNVIGYLLISKDISEETRLTEELEAAQLYTRSLIESNIDALMTTDPVGVITDVNQQMETLTGRTRKELVGTPFKNYFTEPKRAEEGIRLVLAEGKVTNYELTAASKDGKQTVVSYNATTFYDRDQKLQGVFAAARDVSVQKALEEKLRDQQTYLRGLIESSVDGLVTVDSSGSITDVNEQLCRMAGFGREELIGTQLADYFSEPEFVTKGVRDTFEKGLLTDYVLTLVQRDGGTLQVSFNASVFHGPDGRVRGIFASARDITEGAGLQNQLAEERAYNRGLIEASLDGLITVDPLLQITDVNETMCSMTGFSREELIGTYFQSYFVDEKRAAQGVRLTLDKGAVTNYELTLREKSGNERLVSFNAAVFKDEEGHVRGIFASARDITEQAQLQGQLAEERAYNRGLIEASVDGLVTVDHLMKITDVNETFCRMIGRSRDQLIGSAFPTHFSERDRAVEGVDLTFEKGSVTDYVLTLESGERSIPVSLNAAVFRDSGGEVKGIFASARDITAQKELEQQLRDSQVYTRSLIESNIDALMTTDSLGIITDVNQQMEALTGRSRDELIGTAFKNYFTNPDRADEGIREVLREGKVTNYELTARSKDGSEKVVSYNATTFFDENGKLQGVFAAARAITEQKELEDKLREQQTYLRGLIESSVDGLVTVDPESFVTDVNERMCRMTGYKREELIGTPFADYFTNPERARAGVEETLKSEYVTEYALTLVSRSRRELEVSFNASVFRSPDGEVRGIFASARDVADRVRLEEQLREQQNYLRGLIESSVDGLVTVDPDGFITDVNEQFCRMTDYSRDELIGSPFRRYFADGEAADRGVRLTVAEGIVTNYELVLTTKGGRKTTVSFNASIFRSPDGEIQGIFASARDISEQARLQTQLGEQQAYNRSLIEASADALFAIAPEGVIIDVNEEATRVTGYTRKQLINSRFREYFTEPDKADAGVNQTFEEGRVLGYELTLISRGGRKTTVSFNAGVFTSVSGEPLGILAAARDITAQKELEQQLRDSQIYTRSLIESNIDALMTTDPLGIITDVNEQMEELTGYARDELVGSAFKEYFIDSARAEEGIKLVLRDGKVTNYELTAKSKSGYETVVSYNATTFFDREGKLKGVFAAARDITEQKAAEEALAKAHTDLEGRAGDLERSNIDLAQFAYVASHDLAEPLRVVSSYVQLLESRYKEKLDARAGQYVQHVVEGVGRMQTLIGDLLAYSRVGTSERVLEDVDLSKLVEGVLNTTSQAIKDRRARVEMLDLPVIKADPIQMQQLIQNLILNALKFTAPEVTPKVTVAAERRNGFWTLSVADNGIGVSDKYRDHIFLPFKRLNTKDEYPGSGIGLAICKRIVERHGGTIWNEGAPEGGTIFYFSVPEQHENLA